MKVNLIFLLSLFLLSVNHTIFTMEENSFGEDKKIPEYKTVEEFTKENEDVLRKNQNFLPHKILGDLSYEVFKIFELKNDVDSFELKKVITFLNACYEGDIDKIDMFFVTKKNEENKKDKKIFKEDKDKCMLPLGLKLIFKSFDDEILHPLMLQEITELFLDTGACPQTTCFNNKDMTLVEYVWFLLKEKQIIKKFGNPILKSFVKNGFEFKLNNQKENTPGDTILHRIVKAYFISTYDHDFLTILFNYALECGIDPNEKNDKDRTPFYYVDQNKKEKVSGQIINTLLAYGANPYLILETLNNKSDRKNIKKFYDYWRPLGITRTNPEVDYSNWEEYGLHEDGLNIKELLCYQKIKCIRNKFRLISKEKDKVVKKTDQKINENLPINTNNQINPESISIEQTTVNSNEQTNVDNNESIKQLKYELDNSKGRIVVIVVHGTGFPLASESGPKNPNYYDKHSDGFAGIMKFAQEYLEKYNKENPNNKKVLHLLSFEWSGNLTDIFHRNPAGTTLYNYLQTWNYKDSILAFIAHSHGCNIVNFISHLLPVPKEENDIIRENGANKPYKGRIETLIYFAPPCRQKELEKSVKKETLSQKTLHVLKKTDVLGELYNYCKNKMANEPTNYNRIIIFHSPDDYVVKVGSIDGYSALLATGSLAGSLKGYLYVAKQIGNKTVYEHFKQSDPKEKVVIIVTSAGLIVYPLCKVAQTLYAARDNHRYKNIIPVNEYNEEKKKYKIKGPKIHIETSVDGEYIGHSSTELLQHFSKCCNFINGSYSLYAACSGSFNFNMSFEEKIENNKKEKIYKGMQCYLKQYPYSNTAGKPKVSFGYNNNDCDDLEGTIYAKLEKKKQREQQEQKNEEEGIKHEVYEDDRFTAEQVISNTQEKNYALLPKTKSSCSLL